ncbi:DRP2A [Linum grandiflorum]
MEAIEELSQLFDSMRQVASLHADEDIDESASSSAKRSSTFLNVVVLGVVGAGKSAVLNSLIGHLVLLPAMEIRWLTIMRSNCDVNLEETPQSSCSSGKHHRRQSASLILPRLSRKRSNQR